MKKGISSSDGKYSGGSSQNGLTSWNEDFGYVNNQKRSSVIFYHDDCRRRTGDFIVKVRNEDGTRNDHGHLEKYLRQT